MNAEQLKETCQFILNAEARRDGNGHLVVYKLPAGDGGGRYEVAGINEKYDNAVVNQLVVLLNKKLPTAAEELALAYYATNTAAAALWTSCPAIEAWLRDAVFNRGRAGAARCLQIALGLHVDGQVGPRTLAAVKDAEQDPRRLLRELHAAAETYERRIAPPVGKRAKFWRGLVNRWNARLEFCLSLLPS